MLATSIWKKLGFSSAALCAALAFVQPQAAAAQDRDDYRYGSGYNNAYNNGYNSGYGYRDGYAFRNSHEAHEYRERIARERRAWREHERREQALRWRRYHDRDDYRYNDSYYR